MPYDPDDTICAIATAAGGAARGMVRISGPNTIDVASKLFQPHGTAPLHTLRKPTAVRGEAQVRIDGEARQLPCDAFVWPLDRSYTREPVVELHTIGSPTLLEAILTAVCDSGARLAEPGEFTLRAFLAGRIDLTRAEAVLGVINARAADDLRTALAQLAGGLSTPLMNLRDELLQLLAELEAGLDFIEEDIEFVTEEALLRRLRSAADIVAKVSDQMSSRHVGAANPQIVLLGRPNAGKSSLFNALVARYGRRTRPDLSQPAAALVSRHEGTTRDYLTAEISLDGIECEIVDTAGIGAGSAADRKSAADSLSSACDPTGDITTTAEKFAERKHQSAALRVACIEAPVDGATAALVNNNVDYDVLVVTKGDLLQNLEQVSHFQSCKPLLVTSSILGTGLEELKGTLRTLLMSERTAQRGQAVAATASRCQASIHSAEVAIRQAIELASTGMGNELIAVELRTALDELGKVVGIVYTDDLLDRIFSTFCIGK